MIIIRAAPRRNPRATLRTRNRVVSSRSSGGVFPIYVQSKKVLVGSSGRPFSGLDYVGNFRLHSARWRYTLFGFTFTWNTISIGIYTDLLSAVRFLRAVFDFFGVYRYELELTNELNEVSSVIVDVDVNVKAGADKNVKRNITFRPFSDCQFFYNPLHVSGMAYEVSGDIVVANTELVRPVLLSGRVEVVNNSLSMFDGRKNFNNLNINVGIDRLRNKTTNSVGTIVEIVYGGHGLRVSSIGGGNFSAGDEYEILDGRRMDQIARSFELSFNAQASVIVRMRTADLFRVMRDTDIAVRCD